MSSTLGAVKREGGHKVPAINKERRSQLLNDFCIFLTKKSIFNTLDVVFDEIF